MFEKGGRSRPLLSSALFGVLACPAPHSCREVGDGEGGESTDCSIEKKQMFFIKNEMFEKS